MNDKTGIQVTTINGKNPHLHIVRTGESSTDAASNGPEHLHSIDENGLIMPGGEDGHTHEIRSDYVK